MSEVQYYLNHISAYEREFKKWEGRASRVLKTYRAESGGGPTKFNVLWSNVQTLKSATFARRPMPDVSRRFKDNDPVGRVAALILERALEFEVRHNSDYGASITQCVYDRFLGGRGCAWVRYELEVTEDIPGSPIAESCPVDYVHWKDFGHAVARTWEELPIVWRKVYMTRNALRARWPEDKYGHLAETIPLDAIPEDQKSRSVDPDSVNRRALIYEIWDKEAKKALWLSKSMGEIVEELDDPLGLEGFFPCPPPLYSTLTTDSLVPIPDYTMYQEQAISLNTLADRIDKLVVALQVKGVHDASIPELSRLFSEAGNTDLIPVHNWAAFAEKQGLKGAIDIVDLVPIANALKEAYLAFEQIKSQIYELTGISDIVRGDTKASETATAQQIKNSYASMRLKTYQDEVERFATRLLQIKAQIICSKYDDATLIRLSSADQLSEADQALVPEALQMLKNDVMRVFRIEVATDSMVYQDEQQEKTDRMEFLGATSQFIEKAVQAGSTAPQLIPLAVEMLKFGVTGFRVGKGLEGTIDQAAEQLKAKAAQDAANPPPHPDAIAAQADQAKVQVQEQSKQALEQVRQGAETQRRQMEMEHDQRMAAMKAAQDAQEQEAQRQHEAFMAQVNADADERLKRVEQAHEAQMEAMKQQHAESMSQVNTTLQHLLQRMKGETAIEVAEINADTTLEAAQISAANQASKE